MATMRYSMHSEQWVPYPKEMVFRFFANPKNLPLLMPKWQNARIEEMHLVPPASLPEDAAPPGTVAGDGTTLLLTMRMVPLLPIRLSWLAKIQEFHWNAQFSDVQVRGPFKYWHHTHSISAESRVMRANSSEDGTLIRDDLEYEVPFGILGRLAQPVAIRYALQQTFDYRHKRTRELLDEMAAAK